MRSNLQDFGGDDDVKLDPADPDRDCGEDMDGIGVNWNLHPESSC